MRILHTLFDYVILRLLRQAVGPRRRVVKHAERRGRFPRRETHAEDVGEFIQ